MNEFTIESITKQLAQASVGEPPSGKVIKFDFGDGQVIIYDASVSPIAVSNLDRDASATVKMTLQTFAAIAQGKENPATALMTGKVKIGGDMAAALDLQKVMERARAAS